MSIDKFHTEVKEHCRAWNNDWKCSGTCHQQYKICSDIFQKWLDVSRNMHCIGSDICQIKLVFVQVNLKVCQMPDCLNCDAVPVQYPVAIWRT